VRIGLLKYREFHEPILRPAFEALQGRHHCLLTSDESSLIAFEPDVVIMGEAVAGRLRQAMPWALFVHTRHGLASKNVAYKGANETDYLCVTSEFVRDWYLQNGARPRRGFWVIGYLQMDELPLPMKTAPGRKTVLYAPTWNPTLSSVEMLGEDFARLLRGGRDDVSVIIKPHPLIATKFPDWMEMWRRSAHHDAHLHLIEDADRDVIPFLRAADLLVTDASSVQLEYLVLDRPMVLINNPRRFGRKEFDPAGFEWAWRDMGSEAESGEAACEAIAAALADPGGRAAQRAQYRKLLFGDLTDGRTAERLAEQVLQLERFLPLIRARWITGWPLRRARDLRRRAKRFFAAVKTRAIT
jgi:CDP-glycerol glycerophosphotransferase (TagB/SpsB family)